MVAALLDCPLQGLEPHPHSGPLNKRPEFSEPRGQCRHALASLSAAGVGVLAGSVDKCAKGPALMCGAGATVSVLFVLFMCFVF